MSHPYTDYPSGIPTSEQRISALEQRTAKIEAQLGAATSGVVPVSAADCSGLHTTSGQSITQAGESGSGSAAAPSVSAERSPAFWRSESSYHRKHNSSPNAADACDLAAAVTRWYEDPKNDHSHMDYMKLYRIIQAFARGEKLPEVGT